MNYKRNDDKIEVKAVKMHQYKYITESKTKAILTTDNSTDKHLSSSLNHTKFYKASAAWPHDQNISRKIVKNCESADPIWAEFYNPPAVAKLNDCINFRYHFNNDEENYKLYLWEEKIKKAEMFKLECQRMSEKLELERRSQQKQYSSNLEVLDRRPSTTHVASVEQLTNNSECKKSMQHYSKGARILQYARNAKGNRKLSENSKRSLL